MLQLEAQLAERRVAIALEPEARAWLAEKGYDPVYGARPLARVIQAEVRDPLTDEILFGRLEHGGTVRIGLKDDALTEAVGRTLADVLVVRGTKVTAPMLDAGRLALIVRAGAGYNTIDVAGASKRGIYVSNCPGKNAIAVAELAFALILALDRRVPDNVADLRAGRWNTTRRCSAISRSARLSANATG